MRGNECGTGSLEWVMNDWNTQWVSLYVEISMERRGSPEEKIFLPAAACWDNQPGPSSTGVPWNAVVFAQTSDQVTSGTTRQSVHNSSFPESLTISVGR